MDVNTDDVDESNNKNLDDLNSEVSLDVKEEAIVEEKNVEEAPKTLLAKEQIKKRLQSFSLMKQGIQALPIKKIIKPNKVLQVVGEASYDENGEKSTEKIFIKKPPKKSSSNHFDKAKAVMDEIEEIKRVEKCFYSNPYITPGIGIKIEKDSSKQKSDRKKDKKRSSDKDRKRNNDIKIPETWQPIKEGKIDFDAIRKVKEKTVNIDHRKDRKRDRR